LQELGRATFLYASFAVEHGILCQSHSALGPGLEGDGDARIPFDVLDFAVPGKMACYDFVPVQPDPHQCDLRAPIPIEGDKVSRAA
jgi:hypothetical protein